MCRLISYCLATYYVPGCQTNCEMNDVLLNIDARMKQHSELNNFAFTKAFRNLTKREETYFEQQCTVLWHHKSSAKI